MNASRGANGDNAAAFTSSATPTPLTSTRGSPVVVPSSAAQAHSSNSIRPSRNAQSPRYDLSIATNTGFNNATGPARNTFSPTGPGFATAILRGLPSNTTEESVRLMCVSCEDLIRVIVHAGNNGSPYAVLRFQSAQGAVDCRDSLNGKASVNGQGYYSVEIVGNSPQSGRSQDSVRSNSNAGMPNGIGGSSHQSYSGGHDSRHTSPHTNGGYVDGNFNNASTQYQSIFSPQSPIGNQLVGSTGASMINNDGADDDDTADIVANPMLYAQHAGAPNSRQQTPADLAAQFEGINLGSRQTNGPPRTQSSPYGRGAGPSNGHSVSHRAPYQPNIGPGRGGPGPHGYPQTPGYINPPANPADSNPPCNTLYVGNLPHDTHEEELKALFQKQRGYKRMLFRVQQGGPMGFVEFENVSFATKALHALYGHLLHNSVRGGIRLSFSKNPLGVRNNHGSGHGGPGPHGPNGGYYSQGHGTANGLPPGLSAPPGLQARGPPGAPMYGMHNGNGNGNGGNDGFSASQYGGGRDAWNAYGNDSSAQQFQGQYGGYDANYQNQYQQ